MEIKCPYCKEGIEVAKADVKDKITIKCPKCERDVPTRKKRVWTWVVGIIVGLFVVSSIFGGDDTPTQVLKAKSKLNFDLNYGVAAVDCKAKKIDEKYFVKCGNALFHVKYDENMYLVFAINGKAKGYAKNLDYVIKDIKHSQGIDITATLEAFE
ncbi:MAG: hypothetical protein LBG67_04570 [Campylobacteraceae bacterium]|jgi:hypothetical protein|nr:hypothetical protein [Campylobacteraceae bacterium]